MQIISAKIGDVKNNILTDMKGVSELNNNDIRKAAGGAGVKLWQIADELGIADTSLSRKLRHELSTEERERVMEIIRRLSGEVN